MPTVQFAHEKLLWLLLLVPALLLFKLWLDSRASRAVQAFTAARLRSVLVTGVSGGLSWTIWTLYLLAMACLVIAAARPQWGTESIERPDKGRNIFIALDTSRSMLARDVAPDRLTREKLAAHDLIMELKGERIGLLAFAGRAYLQAPLTTDHEAILESLQSFDHTVIEWGGSNLGDLLDVLLRAIKPLPKSNFVLIVFSDGGDADASLTGSIQKLTEAQVSVITVGVGTEGGTLIPDPNVPGDYIRDENNNVVRSKLEKGVLQQLASATGGRFIKLGTQPLSREAIAPIIARLREQENATRSLSKPIERFAWPLGFAILWLMIAWILSSLPRRKTRPSLAAGMLAALAFSSLNADASSLAAFLRQRGPSPEAAHEALDQKDYEKARDLYTKLLESGSLPPATMPELNYGLALAEHQLTDYDGSVRHFSDALHSGDKGLRTRAHRGLGHTLYDQGAQGLAKQPKITLQRWMDALKHFDAALELDPNNKELRENREHVARMLEELRKALDAMQKQQQGNQGQKGQQGEKGDKGQQGQQGEQGEGQEGQEGQDGQQTGDQGDGEPQKSKQTGEKKGDDDGIGGKDAKNLPQGRLQAAGGRDGEKKDPKGQGGEGQEKEGEGKDGEKKSQEVAGGDKKGDGAEQERKGRRNAATGYTPGEAEGLLRQYMDEQTGIPLSNRQTIPPANKKDW
jgi:Ca-activated chloride channel family protein